MMVRLCLLYFLAVLLNNTAQADIRKWIDENGKVHYGEKPVTPTSTKMSKPNNVSVENDAQIIAQQRRDHALLASYSSPEEIDLALERNIQIDASTLQACLDKQKDLRIQQAKNNAEIRSFTQNKQSVPLALSTQQKQLQTNISNNDALILTKQQSIEKIKAQYLADKQRFIELKSGK